ncbi:MAG: hypothetical protein AAF432_11395 [Planctomycetota bacterium]
MRIRVRRAASLTIGACVVGLSMGVYAGNFCPDSTGPDVIVGDIPSIQTWGAVGGISAYSIATTSCNKGDQVLPWTANDNNHPVISQTMYRYDGLRMEQVGISFVKHGFGSLQGTQCCPLCNNPGSSTVLGVGCSDPYTTGLNGDQNGFGSIAGLGPRSEINAATGEFLFPYGQQGMSGNAIYKRLQVDNGDLDPAMNPGARYFVEAHYVTRADADAGNKNNNASYREALVGSFSGGAYAMSLTGPTNITEPALFEWQKVQPSVSIVTFDVLGDGRFYIASNATDNGDGTWHYEYAVMNLSSNRNASAVEIPLPLCSATTNLFFGDVDHHSNEPYSGTDWAAAVSAASVRWSTDDFATDPNANAIRWGTLYNFAFDADGAPTTVDATIELHGPGAAAGSFVAAVQAPGGATSCPWDCRPDNGDGTFGNCTVNIDDLLAVINEFGVAGGPCDNAPDNGNGTFGNGIVNIDDLLGVINNFGDC